MIDNSIISLMEKFERDGYVILPERIPGDAIDRINHAVDQASQNREKILLRKGGLYSHPGPLGVVGRRRRIIDFYVPCPAALEAALAKPITDVLSALYGEAPVAFQSLLFLFGSQQNMHQDPAYVVIDKPQLLTASWIALEDIQPHSGELAFYKGSHRGIHVTFGSGKDTWIQRNDDMADNAAYSRRLVEACENAGLQKEIFRPKKGEVLIWHSGLVHGGEPIPNKELTRKSLVTHYCPLSVRPRYFSLQPSQAYIHGYGEGFYASRHYDVRPESNNPYPVYTGGKNIAEKQGLAYDE